MSEEKNPDIEFLKGHVARLSEHYDTVQIFVTKHDNALHDGTKCVTWGSGNWYARYGQVIEWLKRTEIETEKECE